ncbi:MAG TPA: efflux RND transporter periplasmic adaptor subunit [Candidatus Ozemobacteraceae bacterium]|nr:efflux RND transporter periplasmic adaptor subunit [Candidatus Ozemobacteraceae bacterium]
MFNRAYYYNIAYIIIFFFMFALPSSFSAWAEEDEHKHGHEAHERTAPGAAGEDAHEDHGRDHEGHAHGGSTGPDAFAEPCEHKVPIIECDECRYEVGAVRVSATQSTLIRTEKLEQTPIAATLEATGEMAFDEDTVRIVSPRAAGRLASISVRIGDPVRQGQPLAVFESQDLAQAALEYLKRLAEGKLAAQKLERAEALHAKEIGSAQEVQEARAARDLAQIEQENAARRLRLFGLSPDEIGRLAKKPDSAACRGEMILRSPITGRISQRDGLVGDMIAPDRKLLTVADLKHLWAVIEIHERDIADVAEALHGGPVFAEVTADTASGTSFPAELVSLDTQICRDTRTLPIRLKVENHRELLRPGVFVKARLFLGKPETKPTLPVSAVVENEGESFVFVRQGADLFVKRDVLPGRRIGERIVIETGLQAGDEVAVSGAFLLKSDVLREKMGAGCAD